MKALKNFGLGLLWALLSPVLAVLILGVAVFGIVNFLVQFVIMVVNFFRGKKLFPMFPEDEKAYRILKGALEEQNAEAEKPQQQQPVYVQQNFYGAIPPQGMPYADPRTGAPMPSIPQENPAPLPPSMNPSALPPASSRPELASLPPYEKKESEPIEVAVTGGNEDE